MFSSQETNTNFNMEAYDDFACTLAEASGEEHGKANTRENSSSSKKSPFSAWESFFHGEITEKEAAFRLRNAKVHI